MRPERKQGFSTEQVPVSAYGGSFKNLKDLKVGFDTLKKTEPSCRISSSVHLCWELEEPKGTKGFSAEQVPVSAYDGSLKNLKEKARFHTMSNQVT